MDIGTDALHTSASPSHSRSAPPRRRIIAIIAAVVAAALLLLITPLPRGFQGEPTGDATLVSEVENVLGSKHWHHVSAAKIDGDDVTWGGVGADENTEFEIGSITKTFTAALFADAINRGEIDKDIRLGDVWPDLDGDVAEVTLASIAMQRSGLPAHEPAPNLLEGTSQFLSIYLRGNPYGGSATDLVDSLHSVKVGNKEPEYSNFGFSVLGQALAEATGKSYRQLVRERITEPLGMEDTYVPNSSDGLDHGYSASGLPAAPWTLGGAAASGAIRSTVHDLSIWLRESMSGTAPGAEATEHRADYDDNDRIGWAWFTTSDRSPTVTWHNGGTAGYRSFLGFNAPSQQGIIVLADSANDVDSAVDLISELDEQPAEPTASEVGVRL
ncbi:CubicO group peptidase, beta-lactamase class C family [Brevibacterium sp. 239c]|uniref:serine hydrolase domain-containing protein n=1 Tax=Brevibacterium sp. 239c TaxID=1965356 RepID=UPI000C4B7A3D|nr:serine hydrolase domain-containing protein [Brevibacterium sp. 239c]SMX83689.1 CubicO group peptidase, beta-lactamase class C family [Brevibacterium sp. 239c]